MLLKAKDQLHISALGPDSLAPGAKFEVSDGEGKRLIEAGLATEVKGKEEKEEPAPKNKMEAASDNKSASTGKQKGK